MKFVFIEKLSSLTDASFVVIKKQKNQKKWNPWFCATKIILPSGNPISIKQKFDVLLSNTPFSIQHNGE